MLTQLGRKVVELLGFFALITTVLGHHDEKVKRSSQLKRALHNLKTTAVQKANRFLDQVREISFHCSAESELMIAAGERLKIPTPNFHPLNDLVNQLKQSLSMAESHYKEFKDDCGAVITCCTEAAEICKCKAKEATDGKETAKQIRTVAVITSIAVGVVGAFTFGFGLVVVSSAVAGVGAVAVTIYFVHEMEESKKAFRSIGTQFDSLLDASHTIREELNSVEMHRVRMSALLDNLILCRSNHDCVESIQVALRHLSQVGSNIHQTVSSCRQCIESRVHTLQPNTN